MFLDQRLEALISLVLIVHLAQYLVGNTKDFAKGLCVERTSWRTVSTTLGRKSGLPTHRLWFQRRSSSLLQGHAGLTGACMEEGKGALVHRPGRNVLYTAVQRRVIRRVGRGKSEGSHGIYIPAVGYMTGKGVWEACMSSRRNCHSDTRTGTFTEPRKGA